MKNLPPTELIVPVEGDHGKQKQNETNKWLTLDVIHPQVPEVLKNEIVQLQMYDVSQLILRI